LTAAVAELLRRDRGSPASDMDDMSRAELLADIHRGIQRVVGALDQRRPDLWTA
jgi:hypothetical protein